MADAVRQFEESFARWSGLAVIEDCCLALGSTYKGRLCGTFGAAGYWSFQWNKPFTTGLGGMAATADESLAGKIRALVAGELRPPSTKAAMMLTLERTLYRLLIFPRTTAAATALFRWMTRKRIVVGSSDSSEFEPTMGEGFFAEMSPGQARAGLRQIGKVAANLAHRRAMRNVYEDLLREAKWEVPPCPTSWTPCSCGTRFAWPIRRGRWPRPRGTAWSSARGSRFRFIRRKRRWSGTITRKACARWPSGPAARSSICRCTRGRTRRRRGGAWSS